MNDTNNINDAIAREKEIKSWSRKKKETLIALANPEWKFLNDEVCKKRAQSSEEVKEIIQSII